MSESTTPSLTAAEERRWNNLSNRMQEFHTWFKYEFEQIYKLADGTYNNQGMSLRMFLQTATDFQKHLEAHHGIEESYLFPILAKKMPGFNNDEAHRNSHKKIHAGLDSLSALVSKFRSTPTSYSPQELRACLDSFRDVLMRHLDEEVKDLRGENLRKYWTLQELERQVPL